MKDVIAVKSECRLSEWHDIFKNQKESGLGVREFCRQNQIKEGSYYYYLKKLRQKVCSEPNIVEIFPEESKEEHGNWTIFYHGAEIQVNSEGKLLSLLQLLKSL